MKISNNNTTEKKIFNELKVMRKNRSSKKKKILFQNQTHRKRLENINRIKKQHCATTKALSFGIRKL